MKGDKMSGISLKPVEENDVELLSQWLHKDYILKWYKDADAWLDEINNRDGEFEFVHHFIAVYDGRPIGFCQFYDCFDAKEDWYEVTESGEVYSIDYLIGEEEHIGRGMAKEIIKTLEEEIFSKTAAKRIIVQPEKENIPSNRLLLSCGYELDEGLGYYCKNI